VGAYPTRMGGDLSRRRDVIPSRTDADLWQAGADLTASEARKVLEVRKAPARWTPTWNQLPNGNRMAVEAPKADGPTGFWGGEALALGQVFLLEAAFNPAAYSAPGQTGTCCIR
jgi:hypothetical protein